MRSPRWNKILSDLWGNRVRSLLVIASITVGLFAVGVIATDYVVMMEDMRAGYAATNPANIQVNAGGYFDQGMVDHIQRMADVRRAEGRYDVEVRLEDAPGDWITIGLTAVKDMDEWDISRPQLIAGRWPQDEYEIAIDEYKLPDTNAGLGDMVTLETPGGTQRQLRLVGVVHDETIGAFGIGAGFFVAPAQGYVLNDTIEWLGLDYPQYFNTLAVTVTGDSSNDDHIEAVSDDVRDAFEENGGVVSSVGTRNTYDHPNRSLVDALVVVLLILGFLVMFLSGFLITSTLQALLNQQMQQIGVMKTIGARRNQVAGIYMLLIFLFGLIALVIAVPSSYLVGFQLLKFLSGEINISIQRERLEPAVVIIQAMLAFLMPQFAAGLPILQGASISVQEALSGISQSSPPRRSWLDAQISRIRRLSRPMRIAIRNTFRRKGRLILTLITLSLGGAIFIATFNVRVTLGSYADQVIQYYLADVNVTLKRPYRVDQIQQILAGTPGMQKLEGWAAARGEMLDDDDKVLESMSMLAPPIDSQMVIPVVIEGRWLVDGDHNAIVLSELFNSRFPDLHVGDTIRVDVNGRKTEWVVVGFFQFAGKSGGYLSYTPFDALADAMRLPGRALTFRVLGDHPNMTKAEQEAIGREIETRLKSMDIEVQEVMPGQSLGTTASEGFDALTAFLMFLAILTALVGSIGLAGTMSMNVMERTREIGVMRAIGASNPVLMRMVIVEGVLIGILSWIIGVLLAFPISKIMSDSVSMAIFDTPSTVGYTPTGFLIWLALVIVLSVLASVTPARNAARLTIREVLAYE
ncbi:MAG: FtsX-like permease family protein [Chloroflexi bacterium]|nr:FtsX-like permease family protein [Anaerolineaceae bacterium]NMB90825.1 FtsX-like permease family protein [Chloroflexota bacterium]